MPTRPTTPTTRRTAFEGTLSSATQDTNAETDFTWTAGTTSPDVTFTNGQAQLEFAAKGLYLVHAEIVVTSAAAANRQTWALQVTHQDAADVTIYTYGLGSCYIRSNAADYDSGAIAGQVLIHAHAGEKVKVSSTVLDAQTPLGLNNASDTYSQLRVERLPG